MLKRLKHAWERDRLGVLGVGLGVVAFALWVDPQITYCENRKFFVLALQIDYRCIVAISSSRVPLVAFVFALSMFLLFLRRR
jgi:hypothetical protein